MATSKTRFCPKEITLTWISSYYADLECSWCGSLHLDSYHKTGKYFLKIGCDDPIRRYDIPEYTTKGEVMDDFEKLFTEWGYNVAPRTTDNERLAKESI